MYLPRFSIHVLCEAAQRCLRTSGSSAYTVALDELTPAKAHADTAPIAVDAIGTEEVNGRRLQC